MSKGNVQYQLSGTNGEFKAVSTPVPTPGADEVTIRNKATGLNPVDWKNYVHGIIVESWPTVLGLEFAGVIEAVGSAVTEFKAGDEVLAVRGQGDRGSAFQEIVTVPAAMVGKKPASVTFEEAASLPIGYWTAAAAIVAGLGIPLSWVKSPETQSHKSILIIGGSSAVGAAAIEILRAALPSVQILTTSSAKHHAHLKSLGADVCFERSAQSDVSVIKKAAVGGQGVDAILDAVAAALDETTIFDALSSTGSKTYCHVRVGNDHPKAPEGISGKTVSAMDTFQYEGGYGAVKALAKELAEGKFKPPVRVEVVGKGFDYILPGLKQFEKGVSGTKLVVTV